MTTAYPKLIISGVVIAAALVTTGVFTTPPANPPLNLSHTLEAQMHVPEAVAGMLRRSCMDCHSSETRWPWYSRVPPASLLLQHDVTNARRAVNLSEWESGAGRRPEIAAATLTAMCADLKQKRMPKPQYLLLHPDAKPASEEVRAFCEWTSLQTRALMKQKREAAAAGAFTTSLQPTNTSR